MFKETRRRSLYKAIFWRLLAFFNSFLVLLIFNFTSAFYNALMMNITGMIIFYVYERVWNKIDRGKYIINK